MKKVLSLSVILLFWSVQSIAASQSLKCLQNQHTFGILASSPQLDELEKELAITPQFSKTKESLVTFNKYGFDVVDESNVKKSWLIQDIIHYSKTARGPILDVGGGYGRLTKLMLDQGATVVYNDLDRRHLLVGRKLATEQQRHRLYLNTFVLPRGMVFKQNSLSGIVLHRVMHFMTPDQIEESLAKFKRWLVPGGKIFIAVLPPQHGEYREKVLATYDQKWAQGDPWPGYPLTSKLILPKQTYALPETMHVMDGRPLRKALEKYGFVIEKEGFIDLKRYSREKDRDGHELYGVIARKK